MRRLGLALLLSVAACGGAPPPAATEAAKTAALLECLLASEEDAYGDPALAAYVTEVGTRVAAHAGPPGRRWAFHVLDDGGVDAYAFTARHAYVTRGALAILDSEAELAAVLAHEIAHAVADHGAQALRELGAGRRLGAASDEDASERDAEYQADQLAIGYLAAAGYDGQALGSTLRAVYAWPAGGREATPLRVRLARAALALGDRRGGEVARERFLAHLDGLVIGVDPRAGRLEGGRFVSERSGVVLTVPAGLTAEVTSRMLEAIDAAGTSRLLLMSADSSLLFDLTREDATKRGPVERRRVPGGEALVGQGERGWTALVTVGQRRHVLSAQAPDRDAARRLLEVVLASYREVEAGERRSPQRLRIAVADRSATVGELLVAGCGASDVATGRRLGGPAVGRVLAVGERFKCASP